MALKGIGKLYTGHTGTPRTRAPMVSNYLKARVMETLAGRQCSELGISCALEAAGVLDLNFAK